MATTEPPHGVHLHFNLPPLKGVSNGGCRKFVQTLRAFNTHPKPAVGAYYGTIFARWTTPSTYVVYSYGEHWPLHICFLPRPDAEPDERIWVHNEDKTTRTTSKHYGQAHPHPSSRTISLYVSRRTIEALSALTYPQLVRLRMEGKLVL